MKRLILALAPAVWLLSTGCNEPFEPFNEVNKLRILGIRAEPPELEGGQTAHITALVVHPHSTTGETRYRWSWCPLSGGPSLGYRCAVEESQFLAALNAVSPEAAEALPPFDLGYDTSADFPYTLEPSVLRTLCQVMLQTTQPTFGMLPNCEGHLDVSIGLTVERGDERVTAFKGVSLRLTDVEDPDHTPPNTNPTMGDIIATDPDGTAVTLSATAPTRLRPQTSYTLQVSVPETASEWYTPSPTSQDPPPEPRRENLFMTWFVETGTTEFQRTGYLYGEGVLDDIETNKWTSPRRDDVDGGSHLYFVLQDRRGGATWEIREIELENDR